MAPNAKRVFYVKYLSGPVFGEILAKRPDIQLDKLENETPDAEAQPVLSQAHAYQIGASRQVIGKHLQVTDALLAKTPNLVAVSSNGAGYDTIDVDACTRQGIIVVNQSGGNKEAVAEHALAMLLTLTKRIIEVDRRMRRGPGIPRNDYIGTELLDKTIGIIGIGNVGGRLAELCKGLFRMRVLAYDPHLTAAQIAAKGAEKVATLDEMLRQADYVSVNAPYTRETKNMMGAREFALMQKHAYFVTTARGGIHDEDALATALTAKQIAGAGLDVWEDEPPPHDHKLMAFDNVLVSPHTAGATVESRDNMARFAAEQLIDILDGKRPPRLLNPEVWPAYCDRFERILGRDPPADSAASTMRELRDDPILALWLVWAVYWCIAGLSAKTTSRREGVASRLTHMVPLLIGVAVMMSPRLAGPYLTMRYLPRTLWLFWLGFALVAIGLGFSVLARIWLGGNWSGLVTLKQDHELIRSGPYSFVRHPIYTGILLAVLGSAIAMGEWRGLLGLALFTGAFLHKIQIEEQFMTAQFGADYARYRREVPALIPMPRRR